MNPRIFVFEDHPIAQFGLLRILQRSQFEVVGQAENGKNAVAKIIASEPQLVLLDVRMPETDGLEALQQIRKLANPPRCVMYSEDGNLTFVARAVVLGAFDYVLKSEPIESLVLALRNTVAGIEPAEHGLFQATWRRMHGRTSDGELEPCELRQTLTERELQVLRHLTLGLSNRDIGHSLGISIETVKEHVQNILRKQHSNDRTQVAVWAIKNGLG